MTNSAYPAFQALAAYKATQQLDERPNAVLARTHEELARTLAAAISAYEAKKLDEMCRHNARAVQILATLVAAFHGDTPGLDRLRGMYARARRAVNGLLLEPTAVETVRQAQTWAREMATSFRKQNAPLG
jgi:flagellin-specific chaperone FliS